MQLELTPTRRSDPILHPRLARYDAILLDQESSHESLDTPWSESLVITPSEVVSEL